jgi:hypothetical protein
MSAYSFPTLLLALLEFLPEIAFVELQLRYVASA